MKLGSTIGSCSVPSEEQISASRAKTHRLLLASFNHAEHKAFKEHLEDNPVIQNFYRCLNFGLDLVVTKKRTMSDVAPTLKLLLQYGAKWDRDDLLRPGMTTPYHVICRAPGDHHEILQLMIKQIGPTFVNVKDESNCTALMCAVINANIKCVEILIKNGSAVNVNGNILEEITVVNQSRVRTGRNMVTPLIDSMVMQQSIYHCSNVLMEIFDLLLESGGDVNQPCWQYHRTPLMYAADLGNVTCVKKLIKKGAQLNYNTDCYGRNVCTLAAKNGNVDVLKCLIEDNDMDKNSVDNQNIGLLYWAVDSGRVEAVRYLLSLGVTITTYTPQDYVEPCKGCGNIIGYYSFYPSQQWGDAYMLALRMDMPEMLKLMEEYGCKLYKSPGVLISAFFRPSLKVVDYLLSNHQYQLNREYMCIKTNDRSETCDSHRTVISKALYERRNVKLVKLLLEHGADLNMKRCDEKWSDAINFAIYNRHVEIIATFIRCGLNINTRSYYLDNGDMLPFEAAIWFNHFYAAEMLLVSGCSRGEINFTKHKADITPEIKGLLKGWNLHTNIVLPLQQKCRMTILNHLSPRADKKIKELHLPLIIIRYLTIPELDDIIEAYEINKQSGNSIYV